MSNHGFVTSKKHMDASVVDGIIHKLNGEKFGGLLKVERSDNWNGEGKTGWLVHYQDNGPCMWLESKRKFEIRHSGRGDFAWWVDNSITDAVAREYDGLISDEGHGEKYKAEPYDKYPHFRDYVQMMFQHSINAGQLTVEQVLEWYPEELRGL